MFEKVFIKGSSFIKRIGFFDNEIVVSMNGKSYSYEGDRETFIDFLFSESKGKFYNSNIKKKKIAESV